MSIKEDNSKKMWVVNVTNNEMYVHNPRYIQFPVGKAVEVTRTIGDSLCTQWEFEEIEVEEAPRHIKITVKKDKKRRKDK